MHRLLQVCCAAVVLTALAACSDSLVTSPVTKSPAAVSRVVFSQSTTPVCSDGSVSVQQKANGAGSFGTTNPAIVPGAKNVAWHDPLTGSSWIIPNDLGGATPPNFTSLNAPDFVTSHYSVSFTVPPNSGASIVGQSWADNNITQILVDNAGGSIGSNPSPNDPLNYGFNGAGVPLDWSGAAPAAGSHTLDIYVFNNNNVQTTNPTGLDFCFHVAFNPPVVVSTTWCSPGFWKNHGLNTWIGLQGVKYSTLIGAAPLSKKAPPGDPTLLTVISNPNTYGGPAANSVADYLAFLAFGTPIGSGIENDAACDAFAKGPGIPTV
jgi:hypothetical protein